MLRSRRLKPSSTQDRFLRVRPEVRFELLAMDRYKPFSTEDLIGLAEMRLGLPRLGPIHAVRPEDRVTAIAILVGFPDLTVYDGSSE